MIIIFDSETTGKITDYKASAEDFTKFPRIIQLAWSVYDQGKEIKRVCKLIKPDGWTVPNEKFWIENGFTQEKNTAEGYPLKEVLEEFVQDRLKSKYSVAHNISFDSKIIRSEMFRASIKADFTSKKVCTMMGSIKYCNIPQPTNKNRKKFPSLTELHYHLFKSNFQNAHDAMSDVDACAKCFFELLKRKVIVLG